MIAEFKSRAQLDRTRQKHQDYVICRVRLSVSCCNMSCPVAQVTLMFFKTQLLPVRVPGLFVAPLTRTADGVETPLYDIQKKV